MNCPKCNCPEYYYGLNGHSCLNPWCVYFDRASQAKINIEDIEPESEETALVNELVEAFKKLGKNIQRRT